MAQRCNERPGSSTARGLDRWRPLLVLALLVLGAASIPVLTVQRAAAQAFVGPAHMLTLADNGTTLHLPVGDWVELRLSSPGVTWTLTGYSNPEVLHPLPVPLQPGLQAMLAAAAPGESTITATGMPQDGGPAQPFSATVIAVPAPVTSPGPQITAEEGTGRAGPNTVTVSGTGFTAGSVATVYIVDTAAGGSITSVTARADNGQIFTDTTALPACNQPVYVFAVDGPTQQPSNVVVLPDCSFL